MKSGLKFYNGLIIFAVVIICLIFIAAPAQLFLGIYGLAVTEILLLAIALISAKILKADMRATFPMKLPPVRNFFAALFLYSGIYIAITLILVITEYFFPSINDVSNAITAIGSSVSPAMSILIMAFLPAICEELLHRGIILTSFRHLNNNAVVVICTGLIFGLFHLDPYRFLSTALLGGAFAYMTLKSGSVVLPMIFHFITNLISVYAIFSSGDFINSETAVFEYTGVMICGLCLFLGGMAIPLVYTGYRLFNSKKAALMLTTAVILISFVISVAGIIVLGINAIDSGYINIGSI
jgi:membrane protease YdiL (CAAX protease family)